MSQYATLKAAITAAIKQNGNKEITGNLLQQQLLAMVNSLGVGYQYAGVATPDTNPGTPDQNVFYLATGGLYVNFGNLNVPVGYIGVLAYNGEWSLTLININNVPGKISFNADGVGYFNNTGAVSTNPAWRYSTILISDYANKILRIGAGYSGFPGAYCYFKLSNNSVVAIANYVITSGENYLIVRVPNTASDLLLSWDNDIWSSYMPITPFVIEEPADGEIEELQQSVSRIASIKILNGFISASTGAFEENDRFRATNFVSVLAGDTFILKSSANVEMANVAYYDKDKNFIASASIIEAHAADERTIVVPTNVPEIYYVRFSSITTIDVVGKKMSVYGVIERYQEGGEERIDYVKNWGNYPGLSKFFKKLSVTAYNRLGHELILYQSGFLTGNIFAVWIWDKTANKSAFYGITNPYSTIPASGIERLIFSQYEGDNGSIDCIVDWSNYGIVTLPNRDANSGIIVENMQQVLFSDNNVDFATAVNGASILRGHYTLNSAITISDEKTIIGDNCVVDCGPNAQITLGRGSSIQNITFNGGWDIQRTSYRSGYTPLISIAQLENNDSNALWGQDKTADDAFILFQQWKAQNTTVKDCTFNRFDRLCIYMKGGAHQDKENGQVVGCYFNCCWCGIYGRGEFTRIAQNCFWQCVICVNLYGGNISKVGNVMKGNDVGFYYSVGTNGGHGEMVGCEMAHCNIAGIYIKEIALNCGDIITGSQMVDAAIIAETCNCLLISGCRVDTFIKYAAGQKNGIINNLVGVGYKWGNLLYDVPNDTKIGMNTPLSNATDAEINPV